MQATSFGDHVCVSGLASKNGKCWICKLFSAFNSVFESLQYMLTFGPKSNYYSIYHYWVSVFYTSTANLNCGVKPSEATSEWNSVLFLPILNLSCFMFEFVH